MEDLFGSKMNSSHIYIIAWKVLKIDQEISFKMFDQGLYCSKLMKD